MSDDPLRTTIQGTYDNLNRAALLAVLDLCGEPAPSKWIQDQPDKACYIGRLGGTEHRTAGGRAWCYQCAEWCYPESYACPCCEPKIEPGDIRSAIAEALGVNNE